MPVTLDATVGGSSSNTYATLEEADAYFDARLYASAWTSLTGTDGIETKKKALIAAAQRNDQEPLDGARAALGQRLEWPRTGVTDRSGYSVASTAIPEDIKIAQYETALFLLTTAKDPAVVDPLANFAAIKIGEIGITLRPTAPRTADTLPDPVLRLLAPYQPDGADFSRG